MDSTAVSRRRRTAAALHEIWRAPRKQLDGSFEPRLKEVDGVTIDIANLKFEALPAIYQESNLSAARTACGSIEDGYAGSQNVGSDAFITLASRKQHQQWLVENREWLDEAAAVGWDELTSEDQEKNREIVIIARTEINEYLHKLHSSPGLRLANGRQRNIPFAIFATALFKLVRSLREMGQLDEDADLLNLTDEVIASLTASVAQNLSMQDDAANDAALFARSEIRRLEMLEHELLLKLEITHDELYELHRRMDEHKARSVYHPNTVESANLIDSIVCDALDTFARANGVERVFAAIGPAAGGGGESAEAIKAQEEEEEEGGAAAAKDKVRHAAEISVAVQHVSGSRAMKFPCTRATTFAQLAERARSHYGDSGEAYLSSEGAIWPNMLLVLESLEASGSDPSCTKVCLGSNTDGLPRDAVHASVGAVHAGSAASSPSHRVLLRLVANGAVSGHVALRVAATWTKSDCDAVLHDRLIFPHHTTGSAIEWLTRVEGDVDANTRWLRNQGIGKCTSRERVQVIVNTDSKFVRFWDHETDTVPPGIKVLRTIRDCRSWILILAWAALFFSLLYAERDVKSANEFNSYMRDALIDSPFESSPSFVDGEPEEGELRGTIKTWGGVVDAAQLYDYLGNVLFDTMQSCCNRSHSTSASNILVGRVRVRQLRVRGEAECKEGQLLAGDCRACISRYSTKREPHMCAAPFVAHVTEDVRAYNQRDDPSFQYSPQAKLSRNGGGSPDHTGVTNRATYTGGGYVIELGIDGKSFQERIEMARSNSWLDSKTRAVIIVFTLYNHNSQLYETVTLIAEQTRANKYETSHSFNTVFLGGIIFRNAWETFLRLLLWMLWIIHVVVEILTVCYFRSRESLRSYFLDARALNDLAFIILAPCVQIVLFVTDYYLRTRAVEMARLVSDVDGVTSSNPNDVMYLPPSWTATNANAANTSTQDGGHSSAMAFVDLTFEARLVDAALALECVQLGLLLLKCVFSLQSNQTLRHVTTVLIENVFKLIMMLCVLAVVFVAFALLGFIVYGDDIRGFSSFERALSQQLDLFFGNLPYAEVSAFILQYFFPAPEHGRN